MDPSGIFSIAFQPDANLVSEHMPQKTREPRTNHHMVAIDNLSLAETVVQFQIKARLEIDGWITMRFLTGVDKTVPGILVLPKYSKAPRPLSISGWRHDVI